MGLPSLLWAPTWLAASTITGTNLTGTINDLREADEGTYCTATAGGNITVTCNFGSARTHHAICIAGENLSGLAVAVDRSADGSAWTAVTLAAGQSPMVNNLANMILFSAAQNYRYLRLTIASAPATLRIYHICPAVNYSWPYQEDGVDLIAIQADATVLESPQGHLLGIQRNKATRSISINFGQITATDLTVFSAFIDEVIRQPKGFFYVPDLAVATCYFGRPSFGKKYGATQKLGLFQATPIEFIARVP